MLVVAMLPPLSPVSMFETPSIVMLLEFGRWPLTVKLLTGRAPGRPCSATARRNEGREVEEHPPVVGDVLQRFAFQRERPLTGVRLHFGDAAR
jgi:hypothetical protein